MENACFGGLDCHWIVTFGDCREFTLPLVARCARGVCKRGCVNACVEFFLALYSIGVGTRDCANLRCHLLLAMHVFTRRVAKTCCKDVLPRHVEKTC